MWGWENQGHSSELDFAEQRPPRTPAWGWHLCREAGTVPWHSSLSPRWGFLYMEEGLGFELGGCMNHITDGTGSRRVLPPGVR